MGRSLPALLALALFVATTGTLPAKATAQATQPLDEITLVDGTFLRGTIVERSAERIVILLVTGEVRTYATSEVQSAGPRAEVASTPQPVAAAPPPPPAVLAPAPRPPASRLTQLRVWSDVPELSLQRLTGSATVAVSTGEGMRTAVLDQFAILCNVPCDLEIDPGTYQLGVARGTGGVIRTGAPIDLFGSVDLTVGYTNNEGLRIAGWITFIGGLVAATAMFVTALAIGGGSSYSRSLGVRREIINVPLAIAAGVVGAIGIGVGMPFAFAGDGATVTRGRHAGRGSDGRGRAGSASREAEMEQQLAERRSSPATPEALLPIREQDGAVEMDLSLAPGIAHARLAARPAEAARVQFGFAVTGPRPRFEGCTSARLRAGTRAAEIPVAVRTEALSGSVRETVVLDIALTDAETLAGTATIELCGRTVFVPTQHRPSVRAFLQRVVDLSASAPSMQ